MKEHKMEAFENKCQGEYFDIRKRRDMHRAWGGEECAQIKTKSMEQIPSWTGPQLVKKFPAFYQPKDSFLHSQEPATCLCPQPDQSTPGLPILLREDPL